ncbi:hypothetical protein [Achromobacter sp. NFACC18-2]|uniref:hypothetical protein n=1 Tax=Achromobacter sp. NFACC18-2 TaxID=1564112 RepID=UPI0008D19231|nr:hypothetical protein [Achromobacter sp. NFACC18-2]SEJ51498.1 hypothetical protein SAMN03159494_02553 [Achromobacter sp. NFACC18-2]
MAHNPISDIAQAAAEYTHAAFNSPADGAPPAQWAAPLDDQHRLGMAINPNDGSVVLTAWRRGFNDAPDTDDLAGEALLRTSFDTRLGAGLIGGIAPELGASLSLPLYAACDAPPLQAAADALLRELDRMESAPADDAAPLPVVPADARAVLGDALRAERDLARLAQSCGVDALPAGARHFDVLFDDLPGRVTLHPSNRLLIVDFFVHDAVALQGSLRRAVIKSALLINQNALRGHAFVVGLDSRDFVTTTGRIALERLDDDIWPRWLQYQVTQALETRGLVKSLSLQNADISFGGAGGAATVAPGELA